jgi:hypothetical protein
MQDAVRKLAKECKSIEDIHSRLKRLLYRLCTHKLYTVISIESTLVRQLRLSTSFSLYGVSRYDASPLHSTLFHRHLT